jgi:hypothetical protein
MFRDKISLHHLAAERPVQSPRKYIGIVVIVPQLPQNM